MKNKKKFTILLLTMFFMVFGAVGAVFYFEAPGGGVVYAQEITHRPIGQQLAERFPRQSIGTLSRGLARMGINPAQCINQVFGSNIGINIGELMRRINALPPAPPPPPPPSFGATGGATGGSGTPGTGASSITINEGGAVTMSFACVNSTSSSGLNFSTGGAAEGSVSINPLDTTTYTVVCSNGGRSSVDVTVLHPVLEITADPIQVRSGRESLITWSATVVDSCNVTGTNGFSATGLSGSQPSNPITLQSIFTLTCENVAGTLSKNVTVYLIPEFREF